MFSVLMMALGFAAFGTAISTGISDAYWMDRMKADRDRHSLNATSLEKIMELQYVGGKEFRDATAGRIILEAGSGRTRAETNSPTQTAAQNQA